MVQSRFIRVFDSWRGKVVRGLLYTKRSSALKCVRKLNTLKGAKRFRVTLRRPK